MTLRISILLSLFAAAAVQIEMQWLEFAPALASHFDINGVPDQWKTRGSLVIDYMLFLFFPSAILISVPFIVKLLPVRYVHIPNKSYWLNPDNEDKVFKKLMMLMCEEAAAITMFLIVRFQLVFEANLKDISFNNRILKIAATVLVVFTILWLLRFLYAFRIPKGQSVESIND
jgi:hypothetical protein